SDTQPPAIVATTTATQITDVGGTSGLPYSYSIVPVLASGPDSTQAQNASATWLPATSNPIIVRSSPDAPTLSGTVALSAGVRTGDGAGSATWSVVASNGVATAAGTATGSSQQSDPLTWSAQTAWDSRSVADGTYTLQLTVTDGAGHSTQ